jgi:hypothetical protein
LSDLKVDGIIASTGTNTALTLQGKGSGKVDIGDGALSFPDADGNADEFIKTDGSGALSFAAAGGGMVFIETVTASGAASIDFDASLSSTYDRYLFIGTDINPATNDTYLQCRTDSSGGASWDDGASDYSWVAGIFNASGSSTTPDADTSSAYIGMTGDTSGSEAKMGNATAESTHFEMWVNNPSGTVYHKKVGGNVYVTTGTGTPRQLASILFVGSRLATAAIDSIQFFMSSGNIDGTVRLYGIVDS